MYLTKKIKKEIEALNHSERSIVNALNGIALDQRGIYRKKTGIDKQYEKDGDYDKLYNASKEIEKKFNSFSEKVLLYAIEVIQGEDRQKEMNYVLKYRRDSNMYGKK